MAAATKNVASLSDSGSKRKHPSLEAPKESADGIKTQTHVVLTAQKSTETAKKRETFTLSEANGQTKVTLLLANNERITTELKHAFKSGVIKGMIETLYYAAQDDGASLEDFLKDTELPLLAVSKETMLLIIKWCQTDDSSHPVDLDDLDEWPHDFTAYSRQAREMIEELDHVKMAQLLEKANYLDMPGLIKIVSFKMADDLKGKTAEQIRAIYGLPDDLTDGEKRNIDKENKWLYNN